MSMATCDEIRPMLGAHADGELSPIETDAVAVHIEQCGRCRQVLRDQQQVQHVLDGCKPPATPDARWAEIGKRLRMEQEGKGERTVLKTRTRVEALEPTPITTPSLRPDELRTPFARGPEPPRQVQRLRPTTTAHGAPTVTVLRVRAPRRLRARFGWVAHLVGVAAAAGVMAFALGRLWMPMETFSELAGSLGGAVQVAQSPDVQVLAWEVRDPNFRVVPGSVTMPEVGPITLARPDDVAVLGVRMMDANYNVILRDTDPASAAIVWVVPRAS